MPKRIIKKVDFSSEESHIALVSSPANGEEVLLMKNKREINEENTENTEIEKMKNDVQITTSMVTFLKTFFNMYHEDANELAEILGYEPIEWFYNRVGEDSSVNIMKSYKEYTEQDYFTKDVFNKLEKARIDFEILEKKKEEDMKKLEETLEELKKANDKFIELEKAFNKEKEKRESLEKVAIQKEKDDLVEICKGYSFVDDVNKLAEALFIIKNTDGYSLILDTLEKARESLKEVLEKEVGTDESKEPENKVPKYITKTAELIKKRKEKSK